MNEFTLEFDLVLDEKDIFYTRCEVDVFFTFTRGSRSFFDRVFGNWVPGDEPNLTIHSYVIYPEGNVPFDLKKVKKLNPKLDQQIRDALLELDDADLMYDER